MKRTLCRETAACVTGLALLLLSPHAWAADSATEKRLDQLAKRISQLESELRTLRRTTDETQDAPSGERPATSAPPAAPATPSSAANLPSATGDQKIDQALASLDLDRPLAAAPAFIALDVSPETISTPGTPRELAAAILNGVDRDGVLQTGLAIDTAPYQVFFGPDTTLEEYRASYFTRLLYNASLSLATTKAGGEESQRQRLAVGLGLLLYERGDFRMDPELEALARKLTIENPVGPGSFGADTIEEINAELQANAADIDGQFAALKKEIRDRSWSSTAWQAAWVPSFLSESGKVDDFRYDGSTVYTTFRYGFEGSKALARRAQFLAHLRFRQGEHVVDPADATHKANQDTLLAAASLRFGVPDFNGWIEGGYIRRRGGLEGNGEGARIGAGLEKKVAKNAWLALSIGQSPGSGTGDDELFAIGALRFGSADKPRFEVPQ